MVFRKHYTREEARQLLPQIREWLRQLVELRKRVNQAEASVASILNQGNDAGGEVVNRLVRSLARFKVLLGEFQSRQIQIKDIDRGLIDFPAIIGGREVFLCWEQDEEDIEFWHDLEAGYAGREKI